MKTSPTYKRNSRYRLTVPPGTLAEALVTKRQLARHLGFSERWVEMQVKKGMPHRRIGSRLRFRVSEVEDYFAKQERIR